MSDNEVLSGFAKPKVLSVSTVNAMVRNTLEGQFESLNVEGEIGTLTRASSGHLYFTLKDEKSQIRCVMWRTQAQFLRFAPEPGLKVFIKANLTVYEPRGEYQLNTYSIEPAGVGALQLAFEQLKKKLEYEGLFDPERKKPIPFLPQRLGIVTSPSGAAIRDVLTVLNRRYPNIQVMIYAALVQGDDAPKQIAEGIQTLDEMNAFDVIILTRGGGSMEDLWAFNDESVARAIASCNTPVISAIGHEIDFTIADFVADLRAPTPSAAAEIVVGRKDDLQERLRMFEKRLSASMANRLENIRALLNSTSPDRMLAIIKRAFETDSQKFDNLQHRLGLGMGKIALTSKQRLAAIAAELEALSPLKALGRGYSITTREGEKKPVAGIEDIKKKDRLNIRLRDGTIVSTVDELIGDEREQEK